MNFVKYNTGLEYVNKYRFYFMDVQVAATKPLLSFQALIKEIERPNGFSELDESGQLFLKCKR